MFVSCLGPGITIYFTFKIDLLCHISAGFLKFEEGGG